jgi:type IV pilus assembly protein PilY1
MTRASTKVLTPAVLLLAAVIIPLRSDGGATCDNVTGSLASTINNPVAGDEAFFKLPNGPANLMLLMDNSGSMNNLPQCGDSSWDDSQGPVAACTTPTLPLPADPTATTIGSATVRGTCLPATDATLTTKYPSLAWMESVTPTTALPDPGHVSVGTPALLTDAPSWGTGCNVGNNKCLFDPDSYYRDGGWSTTSTSTSATRLASDNATNRGSLPAGCTHLGATDSSGNPITVDLGDACRTCMSTHGYYFYSVAYVRATTGNNKITRAQKNYLFKGTFLNGNPPKFVSARKVIKDLAWMDSATPIKLDQVRLGLTVLDCNNQSGKLIVPLGPSKANSYPPTQANFAPARQKIIDTANGVGTGAFDPVDSCTPLGSALFNIGQYFSTGNFYNSATNASPPGAGFTGTRPYSNQTSWQLTSFGETAGGTVNASWAGTGQCSVCWGCQTNSIIAVTDGAPNTEITFPTKITSDSGISTQYNSTRNCASSIGGCYGNAPKVAAWLHTTDLRTDLSMGGKQLITIHTVGFNLVDQKAINTLNAVANMGGGVFKNATNSRELSDAVWNAVNITLAKENSFSAASANSLQTIQTAASEAYLTRFRPSDPDPAWEGHLFQGSLYDEFLNGCDPKLPPDDPGQPVITCPTKPSVTFPAPFNHANVDPVTGNATCTGVHLIDLDCDEIAEDSTTGLFVKKGLGTPANFPWDAGAVLSDPTVSPSAYKSADETASNARKIFTWIGGAKVPFTVANVTTIKPYLNIDTTWCSRLLTAIGMTSSDPTTECAKQVIYFVRGWDVMDWDGDSCAGPGNPKNTTSCRSGTKGEERDRPNDSRGTLDTTAAKYWKLGDIFHSSPAVVTAPIDEIRCDTGYEKQCVPTLHSPPMLANQTQIDTSYAGFVSGTTTDAYDRFRLDNRTRRRVALVGANDGMLHAFDAGLTTSTCDAFGVCSYASGTGTELWAFIPPDLLPRIKDALFTHQYLVDGSVMLRDVWVDGGASGLPASRDGIKQKDEFHTIAIFGERSGGTQYTALDVTTPDDWDSVKMVWTFPQPLSDDAKYMGQSWSDFAPRPPPIGPVRLASAASSPAPTRARGFEERWIVMINGGYDPAMGQGRAVFMVDVWSGKTLWRFTDDDFKTQLGFSARGDQGAGTSMFPVPAAVALMDVGDVGASTLDVDGFFDTATWGDLGGNVFLARFHAPGILNASDKVTNWWAARTFEEQRRADDLQYASGRSEFYYMTSNVYEPTTKTLRTFLGSGNRERMMQQGAACGPDNLLGCCQTGCDVTATTADNFGACTLGNTFSCTNGAMQRGPTSTTCGATAVCAAPAGNQFTSRVDLSLSCGTGRTSSAVGSITCDASGICPAVTPVDVGHDVSPLGTVPRNRFFGIWAYGRDSRKIFSDQASAKLFDQNRFTDVTFTGCTGPSGGDCKVLNTTYAEATYSGTGSSATAAVACASGQPGGTRCSAGLDDAGWYYEYGNVCPTKNCPQATPWTDEKTGSGATVVLGCAAWGGFRPYGAVTSTDPCTGGIGTPITYGYVADYVTGAPSTSCGYADAGILYRAAPRSTTAPPSASTVRVTLNSKGQVAYSALQLDAGAPPSNKQLGVRSDMFEPVYWLEVPRQLHNCRHVVGGNCE